ncbi:hypothetical protein AVEN_210813-1 [Araneus ventricosus]|uniref:Uncharacterized protein n=1 Tax=Araneus ventricosus TaxID=182803 RepID=A0A4Y2CP55_ARAVE|nr:hypothetical protein AVEN_210813-1 [Araneus ventricosus]
MRHRTNEVLAEHFILGKKKKKHAHTPKKTTICFAEQSKRGTLYAVPSLFMYHATQPSEIGAMAKITLLQHEAYKKATPSSGLTSLGMKIRNRHAES